MSAPFTPEQEARLAQIIREAFDRHSKKEGTHPFAIPLAGMPSPIRNTITKLGGISAVARGLGHRNVTTVQGWWDREIIPAHRQREVLDLAGRLGIDLVAEDVIPLAHPGAEEAA